MLSAEQIAFFKTEGFLIVRGLMDTQRCAELLDMMWDSLPADLAARLKADPTGPVPTTSESPDSLHFRKDHRVLNRQVGTSEVALRLVHDRAVTDIAEALLGAPIRQPTVNGRPMGSYGPAWPDGPTDPALGTEGARGVYFTLPYADQTPRPDQCHSDGHPFQLGMVGILADIEPGGGAFKVWPGSHRRLFPTCQLRYDQPRIPYYDHLPTLKGIVHTDAYQAEIEALQQDTTPVECSGQTGDVVFWHHRLAHMAGHNYSNAIRKAVLADFWRTDFDRLRAQPVTVDMWADWSTTLQHSDGRYTSEFASSQLGT